MCKKAILFLIAIDQLAVAQVGTFSAPVLGFVHDAAQQNVRPILGIPGAARVDDPLRVSSSIVSVVVSPRQDYLLAIRDAEFTVIQVSLTKDGISEQPLDVLAPGPTHIFLSPSGSTAAVVYPSGPVQVVTGLPHHAGLSWNVDLNPLRLQYARKAEPRRPPREAPGPEGFAISDDGEVLAAWGAPLGSETLLVATRYAITRLIPFQGGIADLAFIPKSRDAVVADAHHDRIVQISDVAGAATILPIADAETGVAGPTVVRTAGGKGDLRLFVVNSRSRSILTMESTGAKSKVIACDCEPTRLDPLAGTAVFRLTDSASGVIHVLDADRLEPRVVVVPVGEKMP